MSIKTCLFLRPRLENTTDRGQQTEDYDDVLKFALEFADLTLAPAEPLNVDTISEDLIAQVWSAELVLVDVNRYPNEPNLSPYVAYLLALRHCLGNRTILVARDDGHLCGDLRKHHTLKYDRGDPTRFNRAFRTVIRDLRQADGTDKEDMTEQDRDERPDNPIQAHKRNLAIQARQEQTELLRQELQDREAEIEQLRREGAGNPEQARRIKFRPAGPTARGFKNG